MSKNAAAVAVTSTPATTEATPRKRGNRGAVLEGINKKVAGFNAFARRWEPVFIESSKDGASDTVKANSKAVAERLTLLIATADETSKFLETLKTAGWKATKPRGKSEHREGDKVDLGKRLVAFFGKSGYKAAQLTDFTVSKTVGKLVTVSNGHLAGTYPANWFIRSAK